MILVLHWKCFTTNGSEILIQDKGALSFYSEWTSFEKFLLNWKQERKVDENWYQVHEEKNWRESFFQGTGCEKERCDCIPPLEWEKELPSRKKIHFLHFILPSRVSNWQACHGIHSLSVCSLLNFLLEVLMDKKLMSIEKVDTEKESGSESSRNWIGNTDTRNWSCLVSA